MARNSFLNPNFYLKPELFIASGVSQTKGGLKIERGSVWLSTDGVLSKLDGTFDLDSASQIQISP